VIFIPYTKGRYLLKKMRGNEDKLASLTGFIVSYSEAAGTKMLFSHDLNSYQSCGRPVEKYRQCNTSAEKHQKCKTINITYESFVLYTNQNKSKEKPVR
jgi:hypothetical protein